MFSVSRTQLLRTLATRTASTQSNQAAQATQAAVQPILNSQSTINKTSFDQTHLLFQTENAGSQFAPFQWQDPLKVESTMLTEEEVAVM